MVGKFTYLHGNPKARARQRKFKLSDERHMQHNLHVQDWIAHAPVVLVMRWLNQVTADAMQRGWRTAPHA